MSDRKPLPGKFVWFELVSVDAKKAQVFSGEVLGWRVEGFPMGDRTYDDLRRRRSDRWLRRHVTPDTYVFTTTTGAPVEPKSISATGAAACVR